MLAPFFHKPHAIQVWAQAKGFRGSPYDAILAYFISNSSLRSGTLYDYVRDAVLVGGFDSLSALFESKTGVSGRMDAERKFWKDTTLDFFSAVSGNIVLDDSGNTVKDDSGNILTA